LEKNTHFRFLILHGKLGHYRPRPQPAHILPLVTSIGRNNIYFHT